MIRIISILLLASFLVFSGCSSVQEGQFQYAAWTGDFAVIQTLLKLGEGVDTRDRYQNTPLITGAAGGHLSVVEILLDHGADVNAVNMQLATALMKASAGGHTAVVRILLENGAEVNADDFNGNTALYRAAFNGHPDVVRVLLEYGADTEMKDMYGYTPLMASVVNGHEAIVRLLLDTDCRVDVKNRFGQTALMCWSAEGREPEPDILQQLIDAGADVNATDILGKTTLMWAAQKGHVLAVSTLLDNGADQSLLDNQGFTAQDLADKKDQKVPEEEEETATAKS